MSKTLEMISNRESLPNGNGSNIQTTSRRLSMG